MFEKLKSLSDQVHVELDAREAGRRAAMANRDDAFSAARAPTDPLHSEAGDRSYHCRAVEASHETRVTRHQDAPMPVFFLQVGHGPAKINPAQNATPQEAPEGLYRNINLSTGDVGLTRVGVPT